MTGARLFLLFALLLAGCSPAPRRATLILAVEEGPSSLDPRTGSDQASERLFHLLYRGLFRTGAGMEAAPDLAESAEFLSPTHCRVRLRSGLRFSDGAPLRARDVAFTLRSILDDRPVSWRKADLRIVRSVEVVDPWTLDLHLHAPFAPFLQTLTVGIVPEGTPEHPQAPPPGAGAFVMKEHLPRQWVVLEANPFSQRPPASASLALKVVPDPVVRALELRRGGVDMVVNDLPPDSAAWFEGRKGFQLLRSPGANYAYLGIHCGRPPLDDPRVRRALAMAVDREALLKHLQRGLGRTATGLLCPENWAFRETPAAEHDLEQAIRLLEEAGLKADAEGVRLRMKYKTSMSKTSRQLATAIQEQLAQAGIAAEVNSLEWGTFYGDVVKGDFDLFGLTWVGVADPDALRLRFHSRAAPPDGLNRGRFANTRLDGLLDSAAAEADKGRRGLLYGEAQELLAREVPYVSLWWPDNVVVAKEGLAPFTVPPDGSFRFLVDVRWRAASDHTM